MDTKQKTESPIDMFHESIERSTKPDVTRRNYQIITKEFDMQKFISNEISGGYNPNDIWVEMRDGEKKHIEIKNYFTHNNSSKICLEQYTDHWNKVRGWVHHLIQNKTDYVLFTWHGKTKSCYLILDGYKLNRWWAECCTKYESDGKIKINYISQNEKTGNTWQSSFSKVEINDLPEGTIKIRRQHIDLNDFWNK